MAVLMHEVILCVNWTLMILLYLDFSLHNPFKLEKPRPFVYGWIKDIAYRYVPADVMKFPWRQSVREMGRVIGEMDLQRIDSLQLCCSLRQTQDTTGSKYKIEKLTKM